MDHNKQLEVPKALTLYIQSVMDKIVNIPQRKDKTPFKPPNTTRKIMNSIKDSVDPHQHKGVY